MSYWKDYNEKLKDLTQVLVNYNKNNSFNYVENAFYPHVRDILGLSIGMIQSLSSEKKIKILDYGSNATVWANFANKVDTKSIEVFIYDPFQEKKEADSLDLPYEKVSIFSNLETLRDEDFHLVVYGSVAQYDPNFILYWDRERSFHSKYVLFTHTPLSLEESFVSKQYTDFKGEQVIHSYRDILDKLSEDGYDLIFKSTLSKQNASVEQRFLDKTIYANLLFNRKNP